MKVDDFDIVLDETVERVTRTLGSKAVEYADDVDRLHNFKLAGELTGQDPKQVLAGFMAKHTISIYDMIRLDKTYPLSLWDEKIVDHINYLILLRAIVQEQEGHTHTLGDIS